MASPCSEQFCFIFQPRETESLLLLCKKYINVLQLSSTQANIKKASAWPVFELSLKLLHLLDQNLRSPTLVDNCGFKNCKLFLHPHYLENLIIKMRWQNEKQNYLIFLSAVNICYKLFFAELQDYLDLDTKLVHLFFRISENKTKYLYFVEILLF